MSQGQTVVSKTVAAGKNVWIAKHVSLVRATVITLIGSYTLIHLIHSVRNNVVVRNFVY